MTELEQIRVEADKLGVKYHHRHGVETIKKLITQHEKLNPSEEKVALSLDEIEQKSDDELKEIARDKGMSGYEDEERKELEDRIIELDQTIQHTDIGSKKEVKPVVEVKPESFKVSDILESYEVVELKKQGLKISIDGDTISFAMGNLQGQTNIHQPLQAIISAIKYVA